MKQPLRYHWGSSLQLVWISRRRFSSANRFRRGVFLPFRVWHLEEGQASFRVRGGMIHLKPGDWAYAPTHFEEQFIAEGALLTTLALQWNYPDGGQPLLDVSPGLIDGAERDRLAGCVGALLEWAAADGAELDFDYRVDEALLTPLEFAKFQKLLWALLEEIVRSARSVGGGTRFPKSTEPRVDALSKILLESGAQAFPQKKLIEQQLGLSWRRLEQLFSVHTGMTPRQYHNNLRAEWARHLLLDRSLSIKQIVYRLGFPSVSAFSQWFKARHSSGPARYRSGASI